MNIKKLNEEIETVLNEADKKSAWDIIKPSCKDILELDESLQFYFGKLMFYYTAQKLNDLQDKSGVILVVNGYYYDLYKDGKKVDGTLNGPEELPDEIDNPCFRLDVELREFNHEDIEAMEVGIPYVMQAYGSRAEKCKEYLRKHGIDPEIKYVVQEDVMAASLPSLRYIVDKGFFVKIGQHGKGFYDIPLNQFDRYCKPETEEDKNRAAFIAAQD